MVWCSPWLHAAEDCWHKGVHEQCDWKGKGEVKARKRGCNDRPIGARESMTTVDPYAEHAYKSRSVHKHMSIIRARWGDGVSTRR
jgi:hypothetical protein